jgi:hypothetical protein
MPIWKLKEFWTVVGDLILSGALYFGAKYLGEGDFSDLNWAIAALQPIAGFLVAHFAVERARAETKHAIDEAVYKAVVNAQKR